MNHEIVNPSKLRKPHGYAHAVLVTGGKTLHISGQTGHDRNGNLVGPGDLPTQFRQALENLKHAVEAVGGIPQHIVKLTIYTPVRDEYMAKLREIGVAYRSVFGEYYPAMTLAGIDSLYDDGALVEIEAMAVLPD